MGHGFAEVTAGVAQDAGAYVQADAGLRPWTPVAVYGFGRYSWAAGTPVTPSWMAGVGARVQF